MGGYDPKVIKNREKLHFFFHAPQILHCPLGKTKPLHSKESSTFSRIHTHLLAKDNYISRELLVIFLKNLHHLFENLHHLSENLRHFFKYLRRFSENLRRFFKNIVTLQNLIRHFLISHSSLSKVAFVTSSNHTRHFLSVKFDVFSIPLAAVERSEASREQKRSPRYLWAARHKKVPSALGAEGTSIPVSCSAA